MLLLGEALQQSVADAARVVLTVWQERGFKVTVDEGALRAAIESRPDAS